MNAPLRRRSMPTGGRRHNAIIILADDMRLWRRFLYGNA